MRVLSGFLVLGVLMAQSSFAAQPKKEEEKILYTLGLFLARNLQQFELSTDERKLVIQGLSDSLEGKKTAVSIDEYGPKVREWHGERMKKLAAKVKKKGEDHIAKVKKEKGAKTLPSGVVYKVVKEGKGSFPKATDKVKVHYHGTLIDGTVFDSSVDRKTPATFGLNQVIKCWTQGVQKIKPGGKIKLHCPSDVAYGDRGSPPKIPPGATLVFDVELLEILKGQAKPKGHPHGKNNPHAKKK